MIGNACDFTCHRPYKHPTKDDEAESGIWSQKNSTPLDEADRTVGK